MTDITVDSTFHSIRRDGDYEIRSYYPRILAEVSTTGRRKEAISKGFRILFSYISGCNSGKKKIEMTAPVLQEQTTVRDVWKTGFIMPLRMTGGTTYRPDDVNIQLITSPTRQMSVMRFSGLAGEASLKRHEKFLDLWLKKNDIVPIGRPIYAFYNPPWTLPFFRRNEIMKEVIL